MDAIPQRGEPSARGHPACHLPCSPTFAPRHMIFGLPLDAWILLLVAVGLGLGLEIAFVVARRRDRETRP